MTVRIGISGFGRIGRCILRSAWSRGGNRFEIAAINDLTDPRTLAHLLKYDSVHGRFPGTVEFGDRHLSVDGRHLTVLAEPDPTMLPWDDLGVDVVVEATGRFTRRAEAGQHLEAGARMVLVSAPGEGVDATFVYGVNEWRFDPARHRIISPASCTTNCLVPMVNVISQAAGWVHGFVITIHSTTNDQRILDLPHRDLRRARAANLSIIPTTTGAVAATTRVNPTVNGTLEALSFRVPTANVSGLDLIVEVERRTTAEEINHVFRTAAAGPLHGVFAVSEEPLVSVDYTGNEYSGTVDALTTTVVDDTMVHVLAWYDNEAGYAARCVDLLNHIAPSLRPKRAAAAPQAVGR